jgi:hypothetical protein
VLIVDDQILFRLLANQAEPLLIQLSANGIATTSSWYFRLAKAIASGRTNRALGGLFADVDSPTRDLVQQSLKRLPDEILCPEPKAVVPVMAEISTVINANFINLEALALAVLLDADLAVSTDSPLINHGAQLLHLNVHLL